MNITSQSALAPVAQGVVYHHYRDVYRTLGRAAARALVTDEAGFNWVYFHGATDEQVEAWLIHNRWVEARIDSAYDCTGRYFARSPWIRRVGQRVVVHQSWGLDI